MSGTFVKWWFMVVGDILTQSIVNTSCMYGLSVSSNWEEQVDLFCSRDRISLAAFALHNRRVENGCSVQETALFFQAYLVKLA